MWQAPANICSSDAAESGRRVYKLLFLGLALLLGEMHRLSGELKYASFLAALGVAGLGVAIGLDLNISRNPSERGVRQELVGSSRSYKKTKTATKTAMK